MAESAVFTDQTPLYTPELFPTNVGEAERLGKQDWVHTCPLRFASETDQGLFAQAAANGTLPNMPIRILGSIDFSEPSIRHPAAWTILGNSLINLGAQGINLSTDIEVVCPVAEFAYARFETQEAMQLAISANHATARKLFALGTRLTELLFPELTDLNFRLVFDNQEAITILRQQADALIDKSLANLPPEAVELLRKMSDNHSRVSDENERLRRAFTYREGHDIFYGEVNHIELFDTDHSGPFIIIVPGSEWHFRALRAMLEPWLPQSERQSIILMMQPLRKAPYIRGFLEPSISDSAMFPQMWPSKEKASRLRIHDFDKAEIRLAAIILEQAARRVMGGKPSRPQVTEFLQQALRSNLEPIEDVIIPTTSSPDSINDSVRPYRTYD